MTALLIGVTTFAGMVAGGVIGSYGYRAYRRIEIWGRNMNECDRIFQIAAGDEGQWEVHAGKRRTPRVGISLVPLDTPHPRG